MMQVRSIPLPVVHHTEIGNLSAESVECFVPSHTASGWALPLSGVFCLCQG